MGGRRFAKASKSPPASKQSLTSQQMANYKNMFS